jgi:hypothetical protein
MYQAINIQGSARFMLLFNVVVPAAPELTIGGALLHTPAHGRSPSFLTCVDKPAGLTTHV